MTIHLGIYDGPTGALLLDATARGAHSIKASTNVHGSERCTATVPMRLEDAYRLWDYATLPYVRMRANGFPIFDGRLSDPDLFVERETGVAIQALGQWDALGDLPYTELWSTTSVSEWRPVKTTEMSDRYSNRYEMDTNNRLFIAARIGETFGNSPFVSGALTFSVPSGSTRLITNVSFDYEITGASWHGSLIGCDDAFGSIIGIWDTTAGTGSVSATLSSAKPRLVFDLYRGTNPNAVLTGNTGDVRLVITNLRVTTQTAPIEADDIARHMVSVLSALNSSQLSSSTALINPDAISLPDLDERVYGDASIAEALNDLALIGDSSNYRLDVGVDPERRLFLYRRGARARRWYTDAAEFRLRRSLATLANSYVARYQTSSGQTQRQTPIEDARSIARYGLTRRAVIDADTTSASQAARVAETALADGKNPQPQASYTLGDLLDGTSTRYPPYMLRAGDELVVRGIPSGAGTSVDRLRTVRVSRTEYDADNDVMTFEPEEPLPTLVTMLARQALGVSTTTPTAEPVRNVRVLK